MSTSVAFTSPANEPGTEQLTASDVWAGIMRSFRYPKEFVDYISDVEILSESDNQVHRILHFVEGGAHKAPGGKLDQTATVFPDLKVSI